MGDPLVVNNVVSGVDVKEEASGTAVGLGLEGAGASGPGDGVGHHGRGFVSDCVRGFGYVAEACRSRVLRVDADGERELRIGGEERGLYRH